VIPRLMDKAYKRVFILLLSAAALAFMTPARVFAFGGVTGQSFFFFTNASAEGCDGNILCVKSGVFAGNLGGDAYLIFSGLELSGDYGGQVYSLFSSVIVHSGGEAEPDFVRSFFGLPALGRWTRTDGAWVYSGVPPGWALALIGKALRLAFVLGAAALKKGFFAQGAAFLLRRPLKTARNGLAFCAGAAAVAAVFMLSAVGVPAALLALGAVFTATLLGEVSFGRALGKILFAANRRAGSVFLPEYSRGNSLGMYARTAVGVIITEAARLIPYFAFFADWLLLPVLCCGAVITAAYEGFVKKVFLGDA